MEPMNDAALEREIERTLAVNPSPEFVARVRTRIAEEPSRAPRGLGWLLAGVTAAAVTAGVVTLVMLRSDRRVGSETGQLASRSINPPVAVPPRSPGLERERRTTHLERRTSNDAPRTTHLERQVSEPLFDRHETVALQRLIAGVRDARLDLSPLLKEPMPAAMSPRPIDDLVIAPLVIAPLAPNGTEGERP
jgi:hypothetical protein